jgi:hypothetical protein
MKLDIRKKVMQEDARPSPGIWYYLWLKPEWKRIIVRYTDYGPYGHPEFWEEYIAHEILSFYKIEKSKLDQVADLCYSMPRGRVERMPDTGIMMANEKPGVWYMDYGGDIPSSLNAEAEQRRLISEFNLSGFANRDMVEFRVVNHEKMLGEHKEKLQKLIGDISY